MLDHTCTDMATCTPASVRACAHASTQTRTCTHTRRRRATPKQTVLAIKELEIDGLAIICRYKYVRTSTLYIKPPDGHIEITTPPHTPLNALKDFIQEKRPWIDLKRAEILTSPAARAEHASQEDLAQWKALVASCVPLFVQQWEPVLGVHVQTLVYRNMKSRWGSCQPATGRICINVRLALYPLECLEYVVVHELCHLRERGHGPAFKALMDTVLPDWRERRAQLR